VGIAATPRIVALPRYNARGVKCGDCLYLPHCALVEPGGEVLPCEARDELDVALRGTTP